MSKKTAQNKTRPTKQTVSAYIKTLSESEQSQAKKLVKLFKGATGMRPIMWGSMIGFGTYHYVYDSGREGDMFATGFAMRRNGPTIYIMPGYENYTDLLEKIGPHSVGKSCLYFKNVENIDPSVLQKLIKAGIQDLNKKYPVQKT